MDSHSIFNPPHCMRLARKAFLEPTASRLSFRPLRSSSNITCNAALSTLLLVSHRD